MKYFNKKIFSLTFIIIFNIFNILLFQNCSPYRSMMTQGKTESSSQSEESIIGEPGSGKSCQFQGVTVKDQQSIYAFKSNSVISGKTCNDDSNSLLRKCNNGYLENPLNSDLYIYISCTVQEPAPPYVPPFIEPEISGPQTQCECLANGHNQDVNDYGGGCVSSENRGQHIFYNFKSNQIMGTIIAKNRPQFYLLDRTQDRGSVMRNEEDPNGWKNLEYIGDTTDNTGMKLWMIKQPIDGQSKYVFLRTRSGCKKYIDGHNWNENRTQPYFSWSDHRIYPTALNLFENINDTIQSIIAINPNDLTNEEVPFEMISNLEDNQTADDNYNPTVWGMNFYNLNVSQYRILSFHGDSNIGNENWINARQEGQHMSGAGFFWTKKDFIFDIKLKNGKIQRYFIYRNHMGGHFSVHTTITRHDGLVYFLSSLTDGSKLKMVLENKTTGQLSPNLRFSEQGNIYRIGVIQDGAYKIRIFNEITGRDVVNDIMMMVHRPKM